MNTIPSTIYYLVVVWSKPSICRLIDISAAIMSPLSASCFSFAIWVNQFCHHSPAFCHPKGRGWALSSSQTSDNKEVRKNRSWLVPPLCLNDKVTYTCLVFIAISSRGGHPRCQIHNTVVYWRLCIGLDYNWRMSKACGAVWPKSEQNCPSHN